MANLSELRCWTVLPRFMRYPAPELPGDDEDGAGQAHGFICPGHFIPTKLKHWNKILNSRGPLPYPPENPVMHQVMSDVKLKDGHAHDHGVKASVTAPVAAAAGLTIDSDAAIAFKESVTNSYCFEKLEMYMIHPDEMYIEESLRNPGIAAYIKNRTSLFGTWEVYMISGVFIARGASMSQDNSRSRHFGVGGGAGVTGVAEGSAHVDYGTDRNDSMSAEKMSDFVWAIQLTRVFKGYRGKTWDWETQYFRKVEGSTFTNDAAEQARNQLKRGIDASDDEAVKSGRKYGLESGSNDVFIVAEDSLESIDIEGFEELQGVRSLHDIGSQS